MRKYSPWRVVLPVGIGTCLSLVGDSSLYAVLPTHTEAAGVAVASVGIILSVNRFIRLVLNGPIGVAYDRWPRRPLYVSALFIGAISTAIYGFTKGLWPLLVGRLMWGLAWSGIWVGGNAIILDISDDVSRGKWMGMYQFAFFLGAASGAILGGTLTDRFGFHPAMMVGAVLTLIGAFIALFFLPETYQKKGVPSEMETTSDQVNQGMSRSEKVDFASATAIFAVNRLVVPGILSATLGIYLLEQLGEQAQFLGRSWGVASLTGMGLGLATLTAMFMTLAVGWISDRVGDRWRSAAGGLLPGIIGFVCLAVGAPVTILFGIPLIAMTSGSNQSMSTALIGDIGERKRQGRQLGLMFTVGDLMSAIGPPLAYGLLPLVGTGALYYMSAALFGSILLVLLERIIRK